MKRITLPAVKFMLVMLLIFSSCSTLPSRYSPASREYVDGQSLRTYSVLDKKIRDLKVLENQLDSLIRQTRRNNEFINQLRAQNSSLSEEFSRQIVTKDNEIHKLNLQIGSLQNVLGYYEGIMDSLLTLSSRQSNIYNQLVSVEEDTAGAPVSIQKRQLLLVQKNLDSLQQNYGQLAKTTKNLYEDLSIVESSIMDIIQFSFDKSSRQIKDKHEFLMSRYEETEDKLEQNRELLDSHDLLLGTQARTITEQKALIDSLELQLQELKNSEAELRELLQSFERTNVKKESGTPEGKDTE